MIRNTKSTLIASWIVLFERFDIMPPPKKRSPLTLIQASLPKVDLCEGLLLAYFVEKLLDNICSPAALAKG